MKKKPKTNRIIEHLKDKIEVSNGHGSARDVIRAIESHSAALAARADILLSISKAIEEGLEEIKEKLTKLEKKWE